MDDAPVRYIDTHAHLDCPDFNDDREKLIASLFESGCIAIVNPSIDPTNAKTVQNLFLRHPTKIFTGVGIHPHQVTTYVQSGDDVFDLLHRDIEQIRSLGKSDGVVAIGECGLDYFRLPDEPSRRGKIIELQKDLFRLQLDIANDLDLPVIVHIRDSYEDAAELLAIAQLKRKGVIHCYEGLWPVTESILALGFYAGFTANITYPKKDAIHEVIKKIPLDRIVLETDSPFLSPQVRRGKRNDPRSVQDVARKIAELKGVSEREVLIQTTKNAITLFSLPVL